MTITTTSLTKMGGRRFVQPQLDIQIPVLQSRAGPNQVSEPETRAVADFAFDHANIAAVFCFSPEDNLMHPWKPADNQGRIKTAIQKDDEAHVDYIAEKYREIQSGKEAPTSSPGQGSFSEWAYFHYGRWSLAARGRWIPQVKAEKKADEQPADDTKNNSGKTDGRSPPTPRNRTNRKPTVAVRTSSM